MIGMKNNQTIFLVFSIIIVFVTALRPSNDNPHGNIKFDCEVCHHSGDWSVRTTNTNFKHEETGYPLVGAHGETDCRSCHESLVFSRVGIACIDCHTDIHANELGLDCQNCHTPASWENRFTIWEDHNVSRFPLLGIHAALDCESCHRGPAEKQFTNLPVDCAGCHGEEYLNSRNPDHQLAGFDKQCEVCHSPISVVWQQVQYVHPAIFPLRGAHINTDCMACHGEIYTGTPNQCEDCHMAAYSSSVNPDHVKFGFPTMCANCHNETRWEDAIFDHVAESGFALVGAHSRILCTDCHVNNQISGLPRDCYGCHDTDFTSITDPNHVTNNFNHDCTICHSQDIWSPSTFDHNNTSFQLTGAHLTIDCVACHESGFTGTPAECYACHEQDFNGVQDPNHLTNNFDHDCTICHNTAVWSPADFDHNNTSFPLTGAHLTTACTGCHQTGYTGTPVECFACHETEYNNTNDPDHQAAAFPITCENCHNTVAWDQTTWDHDSQYFPIYSGSHREKWNTCDECHVSPASYKIFECIYCHEHDKTLMDEKHRERPDYQYLSTACYDCHPDGRSEDD